MTYATGKPSTLVRHLKNPLTTVSPRVVIVVSTLDTRISHV